jgi:hypothetical protein
MNVTKLKDYRVAKKFVADSESFMRVIDLSIRALTPFKTYKPINRVLVELEDQKAILGAHLNTAQKILEKKNAEE